MTNKKFILNVILCSSFMQFSCLAAAEDIDNQRYYNLYHSDEGQVDEIRDPYESFNRKIFTFNSFMDYILLKPVAKSYRILVPNFAKDRVGNFVNNLTVPVTVIDNVLQGNLKESVKGSAQFIINSTFGLLGTFDPASKMNLKTEPQTFGSTLARYGVRSGPYLVVPFFGSSNARDVTDIFVTPGIDPVAYAMNKYQYNGLTAASMIHKRHEILDVTDAITRESADPYSTIKSMTYQKREGSLRYPVNLSKRDINKKSQ